MPDKRDMFIMLAEIMPKEMLLQQLKVAIKDYEFQKDKESWRKLELFCMMVATKEITEEAKQQLEKQRRNGG